MLVDVGVLELKMSWLSTKCTIILLVFSHTYYLNSTTDVYHQS